MEKDTVKEALFDGLGTGDVDWSQRLGAPTFLVLLAVAEATVEAGGDIVLEANFVRGNDFAERLARLRPQFVQVHCSAPLELLPERYRNRSRLLVTSTPGASTLCATAWSPVGTIRSTFPGRRSGSTRRSRSTPRLCSPA